MVVRVVLGGCSLGRRFARMIADWPGSLSVLTEDDNAAERLREEGIAATAVSLTDTEAIVEAVATPMVVFVVSEEPDTHTDRLELAVDAFPAAFVVAISEGPWPGADSLADLHIETERVHARDLVEQLTDRDSHRSLQLLRTIAQLDEPIGIVMHDNPDPDAIAAAYGIVHLAEQVDREISVLYAGEISHQENRAFVNLIDLELIKYEPPFEVDAYGSIILVDHAHPGINDQLPTDTRVDIVIDHHPAREEAEAMFVDRRHHVGATSTLVADHILRSQHEPTIELASALWYGIQIDTDRFRRGVSTLDFTTAARLSEWVDDDFLNQIESPQMTANTLETIGAAIDNRRVQDDVLIASVGRVSDRDALAQAADGLIRMEGVSTVMVYGLIGQTVYASARSRSVQLDVGEAIRLAFGQIGNAGGHEDMAGAQIPLGMLMPIEEDDDGHAVAEVMQDRFLEGVEMAGRPLPSGYLEETPSFD